MDWEEKLEALMLTVIRDLEEVKQKLSEDRKDLSQLPAAINNLSSSIHEFKKLFSKAVPIDIVAWMFMILVLALSGVEAVQWIFKSFLNK